MKTTTKAQVLSGRELNLKIGKVTITPDDLGMYCVWAFDTETDGDQVTKSIDIRILDILPQEEFEAKYTITEDFETYWFVELYQ